MGGITINNEIKKVCRWCKRELNIEKFTNNKGGHYGKSRTCKTCAKNRKYMRKIKRQLKIK